MKAVLVFSLLLGLSACSDDGDGGGGVDASGTAVDASSVDANSNAPDAMASAPLAFMTQCDVADDKCDTAAGDFCFAFNNRGPHCTHSCTDETMCPAPSRGCNNQGVCKSP